MSAIKTVIGSQLTSLQLSIDDHLRLDRFVDWTAPITGRRIWSTSGTGKSGLITDLLAWYQLRAKDEARERLRGAAEALRSASNLEDRRSAAREFLAALGALIARLLDFLLRLLIMLLSRLLGRRAGADDIPVWNPEPIDAFPQVAPRGPNAAFLVFSHRGGHQRSALGSAVPAA